MSIVSKGINQIYGWSEFVQTQIAENGQPAVSAFRYATSTEPVKFLILELFKKVR